MKIEYPIINLTYPEWTEELFSELIRYDDIYHSSDEAFFQKYFHNQEFVDCNGDIYLVIGKEKIAKPWYAILGSSRSKIIFRYIQKKISYKDLKISLLKRANSFESKAAKVMVESLVEKSKNIRELIEGVNY